MFNQINLFSFPRTHPDFPYAILFTGTIFSPTSLNSYSPSPTPTIRPWATLFNLAVSQFPHLRKTEGPVCFCHAEDVSDINKIVFLIYASASSEHTTKVG